MDKIPEIKINLDEPCKICGRGGAIQHGVCLKCVTKNIEKILKDTEGEER